MRSAKPTWHPLRRSFIAAAIAIVLGVLWAAEQTPHGSNDGWHDFTFAINFCMAFVPAFAVCAISVSLWNLLSSFRDVSAAQKRQREEAERLRSVATEEPIQPPETTRGSEP